MPAMRPYDDSHDKDAEGMSQHGTHASLGLGLEFTNFANCWLKAALQASARIRF